jgi:hypothetical protein
LAYSILALCALTFCAPTVFAAELVTACIDSGGGRGSGGDIVNDGCVGGVGGVSAAGANVARQGFPGQLTEAVSVSVAGTPAQVSETGATQLGGAALMDDDTVTALAGNEIAWASPTWPLHEISASGAASATAVYAETSAPIGGTYHGVYGAGSLLVLDTFPDNYGSYAGDGLPDSWQTQYFGLGNPDAASDKDVTGTGQNNLFKYVAGLDPTNAASVFVVKIANVPGQPGQKALTWKPWAPGRVYTPTYRTNLVGSATWDLVGSVSGPATNANEITVTDLDASDRARFYRIQITLP